MEKYLRNQGPISCREEKTQNGAGGCLQISGRLPRCSVTRRCLGFQRANLGPASRCSCRRGVGAYTGDGLPSRGVSSLSPEVCEEETGSLLY